MSDGDASLSQALSQLSEAADIVGNDEVEEVARVRKARASISEHARQSGDNAGNLLSSLIGQSNAEIEEEKNKIERAAREKEAQEKAKQERDAEKKRQEAEARLEEEKRKIEEKEQRRLQMLADLEKKRKREAGIVDEEEEEAKRAAEAEAGMPINVAARIPVVDDWYSRGDVYRHPRRRRHRHRVEHQRPRLLRVQKRAADEIGCDRSHARLPPRYKRNCNCRSRTRSA